MAIIQQRLSLQKVDPGIDTLIENYCSNMLSVLQASKGSDSRLKSTRYGYIGIQYVQNSSGVKHFQLSK